MTGTRIEACPDCEGHKRHTVSDPDADGRHVVVDCEGCEGQGRMVVCATPFCFELIVLSEAAREGYHCAACRAADDLSEAEAQRLQRAG